jgi:hypothetical protein
MALAAAGAGDAAAAAGAPLVECLALFALLDMAAADFTDHAGVSADGLKHADETNEEWHLASNAAGCQLQLLLLIHCLLQKARNLAIAKTLQATRGPIRSTRMLALRYRRACSIATSSRF